MERGTLSRPTSRLTAIAVMLALASACSETASVVGGPGDSGTSDVANDIALVDVRSDVAPDLPVVVDVPADVVPDVAADVAPDVVADVTLRCTGNSDCATDPGGGRVCDTTSGRCV